MITTICHSRTYKQHTSVYFYYLTIRCLTNSFCSAQRMINCCEQLVATAWIHVWHCDVWRDCRACLLNWLLQGHTSRPGNASAPPLLHVSHFLIHAKSTPSSDVCFPVVQVVMVSIPLKCLGLRQNTPTSIQVQMHKMWTLTIMLGRSKQGGTLDLKEMIALYPSLSF